MDKGLFHIHIHRNVFGFVESSTLEIAFELDAIISICDCVADVRLSSIVSGDD